MVLAERRRHVVLGSALLFAVSTSNLLHFSFAQDQRDSVDCGPLCFGYLQSFTSAMSFVGAVAIGNLSDRLGRVPMLYCGVLASITASAVAVSADSSFALFLAAIPASLNQNHAVMKALVSDWFVEGAAEQVERASSMGLLGMAAGLSFMAGPLIGAAVFTSFRHAKVGAIVGLGISSLLLQLLPTAKSEVKAAAAFSHADVQSKSLLSSFADLFSLHKPGAWLLITIRMSMGLAYSVFNGVFLTSLRTRFDFTPLQYGLLMSWIGLSYSLAQGFWAKIVIKLFNDDVRLLLTCAVVLGAGRALQLHVASVLLLYVIIFAVITALGTINTLISTATSKVAKDGSVGGLFGSMEAVEKLSALFGPIIGGVLFNANPYLPTTAVVLLYGVVFTCIMCFYQHHVILASDQTYPAQLKKLNVLPPTVAIKDKLQ